MIRPSLRVSLLIAMGCMAVLGYSLVTRRPGVQQQAAHNTTSTTIANPFNSTTATLHASLDTASSSASETASPPQSYPADIVAKWIEAGDDSSTRAAEIHALATAPRLQAVPVLERVLVAGDDEDRRHAVDSLHTLALRQGDADGVIRDVLRQAIFHNDGALIADAVQAALVDIEQTFNQQVADR